MDGPLLTEVQIRDFRTIRDLTLAPGPVCALIGETQAGKSNLLVAIRAALDPAAARLTTGDVRHGQDTLAVRARLAGGASAAIEGRPPDVEPRRDDGVPPVRFLAAADRLPSVVADLERELAARTTGTIFLIEEPEQYLRPQAQRYLSRVLRGLAAAGNQVLYSTRAPAFLNVARMDELVFVERRSAEGTLALRPEPLTPDEDFRILSEFDAERAELFLAHAALLVEGATEKLALPFVFAAIGRDADREGISIVECGGKANMVLFARVCRAAGVPFVILFDRDARAGRPPSASNRDLNARLEALADPGHAIEMAPDFEWISHLPRGGHKPERAWRRFAGLHADRMPGELVRAAKLTLALARDGGPASAPPA